MNSISPEEGNILVRMVLWLQTSEQRFFFLINHRMRHRILDFTLSKLTHLGGAAFTLLLCISVAFFAAEPWSSVGWQSLLAVSLSHIPVAVFKKIYKRPRPYMVLEQTHTCSNLLKDHSFPSGHTTAIFSVLTPFMIAVPLLGFILLPIAVTVGFSRIYLGLHYPSDVAAGCIVGVLTAWLAAAWLG